MPNPYADLLLRSRKDLFTTLQSGGSGQKSPDAAEGGCGVLGFAANIPVAGRHVLSASSQMHNRGNGKGGGIAMVGLDASQARVDPETLRTQYLLQIALLDPQARGEVESGFITPHFEVASAYELDHVDDVRAIPGLEVRPPDVWRYFVRVKPGVLADFAVQNELENTPRHAVEAEFVYQNSYRLNTRFYASLGDKRAFVLSHGRDLSVLKIVGYAEEVVAYYLLGDQTAHVWIAHQRYPTKGRVWHPGGAHPFIGLNEALVHNGDFANYHAVSEYLHQRNIGQLFLTDTEVSVQLFDLWDRVYGYPLEVTLEAMAPTTEHDFGMLSPEKQELYQAVQRTHIHGSPDGPWFFILARSQPDEHRFELLGITDTSMLRPQVFALYENSAAKVEIGLIASERQAINACLRSLSAEDERFQPVADRYWAARGGSHTDGGAFRFSVEPAAQPRPGKEYPAEGAPNEADYRLRCANKFGVPVTLPDGYQHVRRSELDPARASLAFQREWESQSLRAFDNGGAPSLWRWLQPQMKSVSWDELVWGLDWLRAFSGSGPAEWCFALEVYNLLNDRHFSPGKKKPASITGLVGEGLEKLFAQVPLLGSHDPRGKGRQPQSAIRRLTWETRQNLSQPEDGDSSLAMNACGFPPEGEECAARWMARAVELGWKRLIVYNWRGGRFAACGLGPDTDGLRVDLYGDVGDYTASGLDGAEVHLHGAGQDQVGQILKRGKLVIHGDVGQTFLYGAKGGEIYVLGSAAGRPLINAVGRPRAVINGTCLDYLAESFMAGDPHQGGGFVILNGITFDEHGNLQELDTPYPGGNLFSLASGGAIYLRDPHHRVDEDQLNGGAFGQLTPADWALIEPHLQENERLFGVRVDDLLKVEGKRWLAEAVYRKVEVRGSGVLREVENR